MLKALSRFIRERFSLKATVPLSLVLFAAPAGLLGLEGTRVVTGLITTFLALLTLRIADDISDMKTDETVNPKRGLISGRIDVNMLRKSAFACCFTIFLLNFSLPAFLTVLTVTVCYLLFYLIKHAIPYVLQPLFVNMVFPAIPIYTATLKDGNVDLPLILMALFTWLAVIAHDYAHSVHGPSEGVENIQSFSGILGSGRSATLAALLFICSGFIGFLFWYQSDLGLLFPLVLTCTLVLISGNCVKLLKNPVQSVAGKFYISGFAFFLAPLAAVSIETTFKAIGLGL